MSGGSSILRANRPRKIFSQSATDVLLTNRVTNLENNVYKVTYYEIISGASGSLTVPTGATINAYEFSGANCVLSEIDINNKPTWVSPKTVGGTVVTASLNTGTGAWVKSGVTVSANVALIYSVNIKAIDYSNLNNFYIIDEVVIGDFSYTLNNTTNNSVASSLLIQKMSDETGTGFVVFNDKPTFTNWLTVPRIYGGTAVGDGIDYYSTSGNGTPSSNAHRFLGGNNGATTLLTILNDGTIRIPNNRTIQGTDSAGTNRSLITWSAGDNITINGRPGVTDIYLNPTNGGVGLYVKAGGDAGIGVASPAARWHVIKTTEQLRVGYDTSNYYSTTVGSTGAVTLSAVGASAGFTFSSPVTARLVPRVTTITSSATPTINTDNCDAVTITALATAITSMTTSLSGTPNNFDKLTIRIKDNGTARAITWGASFEAKGVALPTTTVISKVLTVGFIYDSVTAKWGCVSSVNEY